MVSYFKRNKEKYSFLLDKIFILYLILIALSIYGCEAPRDNPLDPLNPNNEKKGLIEGTVQSFSLPYKAIEKVRVFWENGNVFVTTDTSGKFIIPNIEPINGILLFEKKGYSSDTINVIWGEAKKRDFTINLNQLPILDSVAIFTSVINSANQAEQSFELTITARINDPDKDIDSVYLSNSILNINKGLDYNLTEKIYQTTLTISDLNISDLEQVIGLYFQINVIDIFNNIYNVGSAKVTRVIKREVKLILPDSSSTVDTLPKFSWEKFIAGYSFKYMLEVFTNDL
ncbi:MAG: hypothetical protein ABI550_03025, partial [Ignavibacteriaceae bacterium]